MPRAWIQQLYRACSLGFLVPILLWPSVEYFGLEVTWNVSIPHVWLSSICLLLLSSNLSDIFLAQDKAVRKWLHIILFTINIALAWMVMHQHMQAWFLAASFGIHAFWLAWVLWKNSNTPAAWWYWTAWVRDTAASLAIFIWFIVW